MKLLITILLLLTVSFASAQEDKKEIAVTIHTIEAQSISIDLNQELVISVKGIKTMDEIDIENYNKSSYLKLIANKKQEPEMC